MQLFTAGILGLLGLVLIVTGVNGSWSTLYGALTHSPSEPGTRRSEGGSFLRSSDIVASVATKGPAAATVGRATGGMFGEIG